MAKKDDIPYNGPVKKSIDGILNCMVQQPNDQSPHLENGEKANKYQEKWKGPYDKVKNVSSGTLFGATIKIDEKRPNFGGQWISRYTVPTPPEGKDWFISGITVDEQTAGDHAILKIDYTARPVGWGAGQFYDDTDVVWTLSWQSYNATALAFCSNGIDPNTGDRRQGDKYKESAFAWRVTHCASYQHEIDTADTDEAVQKNAYTWQEIDENGNSVKMELNDNEKMVYDRYVNNVNATYHYPIITKTTTYYLKKDTVWSKTVGLNIDEINDPETDGDMPFKFSNTEQGKWEFIKVADNVTMNFDNENYKKYVFTETWWGAKKWDEKYYSDKTDKRWKLGDL